MPKDTFYDSATQVEGDNTSPALVVAWGISQPEVTINGVAYDRSALNRLLATLRKARNQTYGEDQ